MKIKSILQLYEILSEEEAIVKLLKEAVTLDE